MSRILVFGDSITKGGNDQEFGGWVNRLDIYSECKEGTDTPVYNLGVSGNISSDIMERMEQEIKSRIPEGEDLHILISVGINDSVIIDQKKERVRLENFKENLKILWLIAKRYSKKVIFVGFNPVDERVDPVPWNPEKSYKIERVKEFGEALREFCSENNIDFIDIFSEFMKEKDYSELLFDGLHPNSEGHRKIYNVVKQVLERKGLI